MANIKVVKTQNGAKLTITSKDKLTIALPENPSTGFKWVMHPEPDFLVSEDFEPGTGANPGSGGMAIFVLTPKKSSFSTSVSFEYKRQWEKGVEPSDSFGITVVIE